MIGVAAQRLIRTKWKSAQQLAEELYAIFTSELPLETDGPIISTPQQGDPPPLQFDLPNNFDGPVIRITRGDEVFEIGTKDLGLGDIGGGGTGNTDFGDLNFDAPPDQLILAVPPPSDNPLMVYGVVRSKLDDGRYGVEIWAKSPLTSPSLGIQKVRQALIDPDDTIPPLTPVMVMLFPGKTPQGARAILDAVMQVPVYLTPVVT